MRVFLHSNNFGSTCAVSIFRLLEYNTSVEELDLSGNSQLAEGDSEAVGCAILVDITKQYLFNQATHHLLTLYLAKQHLHHLLALHLSKQFAFLFNQTTHPLLIYLTKQHTI